MPPPHFYKKIYSDIKIREKIYKSNVTDIKEKYIRKIIVELNMLQIYDIDINENLIGLFNIISDFTNKKKEKVSLAEYIDLILILLYFNSGLDSFLKYQIYSINDLYYLNKYGITLSYKYSENEINSTEDKSIDLIMDLLNKDENNFATMIQPIIVLNYNSLKDAIDNFSVEEILLEISTIAKRLKNIKYVGKTSVCVEKNRNIVDEIETKRNILKKRRKTKNQKKNLKKQKYITKEAEIKTKIKEMQALVCLKKLLK